MFFFLFQHAFGDMIAVARFHTNGRPLFTHWAIYVGLGNVLGHLALRLNDKAAEKDIFHINSKQTYS